MHQLICFQLVAVYCQVQQHSRQFYQERSFCKFYLTANNCLSYPVITKTTSRTHFQKTPKPKPSKKGGPSKKDKETIDETKLAPLTEIPDMFLDMVKNRPEFKDTINQIGGRQLRVATMCLSVFFYPLQLEFPRKLTRYHSGTKLPLLALGLIATSVKQLWGKHFRVRHVFSCEIEPFKQAYIEQNFQPPILF